MEMDYVNVYEKIVGNNYPAEYKGPEQQGNQIKKCSILQPVEEIEYSNYSRSRHES